MKKILRFNPAPGWPPHPDPNWLPSETWQPDPSWPAAPPGWPLLLEVRELGPGRFIRPTSRDLPGVLWADARGCWMQGVRGLINRTPYGETVPVADWSAVEGFEVEGREAETQLSAARTQDFKHLGAVRRKHKRDTRETTTVGAEAWLRLTVDGRELTFKMSTSPNRLRAAVSHYVADARQAQQ